MYVNTPTGCKTMGACCVAGACCSVMTEGWGGLAGGSRGTGCVCLEGAHEGRDACVYVADSLRCTADTSV